MKDSQAYRIIKFDYNQTPIRLERMILVAILPTIDFHVFQKKLGVFSLLYKQNSYILNFACALLSTENSHHHTFHFIFSRKSENLIGNRNIYQV